MRKHQKPTHSKHKYNNRPRSTLFKKSIKDCKYLINFPTRSSSSSFKFVRRINKHICAFSILGDPSLR
jgi:hypothetical protein